MSSPPCPRCSSPLHAATGELSERVCGGCDGRFVEPAGVKRLVHDELGLDVSLLRELVGHFAGEPLVCPSCSSKMSPLRLRGQGVDFCTGCGGLWLDAGELSGVSGGRHAEPGAGADAPAPASPADDEGQAAVLYEALKRLRPSPPAPGTGVAALAEPDRAAQSSRSESAAVGLAIALAVSGAVVMMPAAEGGSEASLRCNWRNNETRCDFRGTGSRDGRSKNLEPRQIGFSAGPEVGGGRPSGSVLHVESAMGDAWFDVSYGSEREAAAEIERFKRYRRKVGSSYSLTGTHRSVNPTLDVGVGLVLFAAAAAAGLWWWIRRKMYARG